jgi:hypothetical protein
MRNALNNLADSVTDPREKKVHERYPMNEERAEIMTKGS